MSIHAVHDNDHTYPGQLTVPQNHVRNVVTAPSVEAHCSHTRNCFTMRIWNKMMHIINGNNETLTRKFVMLQLNCSNSNFATKLEELAVDQAVVWLPRDLSFVLKSLLNYQISVDYAFFLRVLFLFFIVSFLSSNLASILSLLLV